MKRPVVVIFVLLLVSLSHVGTVQAEWDFRDLYLGIGLNDINKDISLSQEIQDWLIAARRPQLADYSHSATKASLLIEVRLDLRFKENYRLVPNFHFWNWGDFPNDETGTETSMRGFGVNTDVHRLFRADHSWQPYIGAGAGLVMLNSLTRFADDFWNGLPFQISRLSEQNLLLGANAVLGVEFPVRDNRSRVFSEIRYETTFGVQQIKFLVGISTF
jgi:hypothetical protein